MGEQNYGGELPTFLHFVPSTISPSLRGSMNYQISVHLEVRKGEFTSHTCIYICIGLLHELLTYPSPPRKYTHFQAAHRQSLLCPMTSHVSETVRKPPGER